MNKTPIPFRSITAKTRAPEDAKQDQTRLSSVSRSEQPEVKKLVLEAKKEGFLIAWSGSLSESEDQKESSSLLHPSQAAEQDSQSI